MAYVRCTPWRNTHACVACTACCTSDVRAPERGELALERGQLVHLLQAADVGAPVRHLRQQPPAAVAPVQAPARRRAVQLVRMLLRLPEACTIQTEERC